MTLLTCSLSLPLFFPFLSLSLSLFPEEAFLHFKNWIQMLVEKNQEREREREKNQKRREFETWKMSKKEKERTKEDLVPKCEQYNFEKVQKWERRKRKREKERKKKKERGRKRADFWADLCSVFQTNELSLDSKTCWIDPFLLSLSLYFSLSSFYFFFFSRLKWLWIEWKRKKKKMESLVLPISGWGNREFFRSSFKQQKVSFLFFSPSLPPLLSSKERKRMREKGIQTKEWVTEREERERELLKVE